MEDNGSIGGLQTSGLSDNLSSLIDYGCCEVPSDMWRLFGELAQRGFQPHGSVRQSIGIVICVWICTKRPLAWIWVALIYRKPESISDTLYKRQVAFFSDIGLFRPKELSH